jgi:hypothetical protein
MGLKRRISLLHALRRDRISGLWLAILLLFVPFIQPLSEANAAEKPFAAVICSTFGVPGQAAVPGLADDCATCIAGQHAPQSAVPADEDSAAIFLPFSGSGPAGFSSPLTRPVAASQWKMKPPGQAPPLSI